MLLRWLTGILLFTPASLLAAHHHRRSGSQHYLPGPRNPAKTNNTTRFINAVTHELKTPVASIRLYLETLQTLFGGGAPSARNFYRTTMVEDSDRL